MKRLSLAIACLFPALFFAPAARAQFVNFTGRNIDNGAGVLLASGQICITPVDASNHPITAARSSSGAILPESACATITNGVIASGFKAPDTYLSNPQYLCLRVKITDTNNPTAFPYTATCAQPGSGSLAAQTSWCTTSGTTTCNFDNFNASLAAIALQQAGPTGPTGPIGPSGVGTDSNCHTDGSGHLTCLTVSAPTVTVSGTPTNSTDATNVSYVAAHTATGTYSATAISTANICMFPGDSITAGYGLSGGQDWPTQFIALGSWSTCTEYNVAISGETIENKISEYSTQVHPYAPTGGNIGTLFILIGTNNILHTTDTSSTIYTDISGYWATAKADGFKVVAFTIPPCAGAWAHTGGNGTGPGGTDFCDSSREAIRQTVNASIRGASTSYDYLVDMDRLMPFDNDTVLYQDGLHPTAVGAVLLANYVQQTLAGKLTIPPLGGTQASRLADGTRALPSAIFNNNPVSGFYRNSAYGEKLSFANNGLDMGGFGYGAQSGFSDMPGVWTAQCFYLSNSAILTGAYQYQFGADHTICNLGGNALYRSGSSSNSMGWLNVFNSASDWGGVLATHVGGGSSGFMAHRQGSSGTTYTSMNIGSDNSGTGIFTSASNSIYFGGCSGCTASATWNNWQISVGASSSVNSPFSPVQDLQNNIGDATHRVKVVYAGSATVNTVDPGTIYSAAGTALPSCASGIKGERAVVSDATTPTYMAAYTSGGSITAEVICSYNGTTYSWLTH